MKRGSSAWWTFLFALFFGVVTGINTSQPDIAGTPLPELHHADFYDPILAVGGGFISVWMGRLYATASRMRAAFDNSMGEYRTHPIAVYQQLREDTYRHLVQRLTQDIATVAEVRVRDPKLEPSKQGLLDRWRWG